MEKCSSWSDFKGMVEAYCALYALACFSISGHSHDGKVFRDFAAESFKEVTGLDLNEATLTLIGVYEDESAKSKN